jgi:serine protease Do
MSGLIRKNSLGLLLAAAVFLAGAAGFGGGLLAAVVNRQSPADTGSLATVTTTTAGETAQTDDSAVDLDNLVADADADQTATRTTSTSQAGQEVLSIAEIAAIASPSVVEITTEVRVTGQMMQQYTAEGAGSGVILSDDGLIVTNFHVIEEAETITVRLTDGTTYAAAVVGSDQEMDLAVLKINASGLQAATLGDSSKLAVGDLTVAIGNPLGELGGTVTDGIISALDREITIDNETMNLLQTNAAINPGNSGGGLFDSSGSLVGIVNAKSSGSDVEGLGFAIPINDARPVIEQLISYGYVQGRIDLGLTLIDISDRQTAMMYRVSQLGVYVLKVTGSSAELAGFAVGDCIVSVDGQEVATSTELNVVLDRHAVGDVLPVVVLRDGQNVALSLTLAEAVPAESGS